MKKSSIVCILSIIIAHLLAFFIVASYYSNLNTQKLIIEISYSGIILLIGALIMYVRFEKSQFVARFMILTVFQILAILAFVLALVYTKTHPLRAHALIFLFTYLTGMVVQTGFFLRFSKETA